MSHVDVWCLGEAMGLIDTTSIGPLSLSSSARLSFGGAESNVAIACARLGLATGWVGVLGDDPVGRLVRDGIRSNGVEVIARTMKDAPTGLMLKERRLADRARVSYYRSSSAGSHLSPAELESLRLAGSSYVHTTGITLAISPSARAAVGELADRADAAGVPLSFDINHRRTLIDEPTAQAHYGHAVRRAHTVFGGVDEYRLLLGGTPDVDEILDAVLELGPREVIIKLGPEGAVGATPDGRWQVAGHRIDVVDTVGAGDAFVAGYLASRVRGGSVEESIRLGNSCGALTCMVVGDWEGAPTTDDLALLADGDPVLR